MSFYERGVSQSDGMTGAAACCVSFLLSPARASAWLASNANLGPRNKAGDCRCDACVGHRRKWHVAWRGPLKKCRSGNEPVYEGRSLAVRRLRSCQATKGPRKGAKVGHRGGVKFQTVHRRLASGWTLKQVLDLEEKEKVGGRAKAVTVAGTIFLSHAKAAALRNFDLRGSAYSVAVQTFCQEDGEAVALSPSYCETAFASVVVRRTPQFVEPVRSRAHHRQGSY